MKATTVFLLLGSCIIAQQAAAQCNAPPPPAANGPNGFLVLCASSQNYSPFGSLPVAASKLNDICDTLSSGDDPAFTDVQGARPAALAMAGYTAGWSNSASSGAQSGGGRAGKVTVASFNVQLALGQPLPPELLNAVASLITYPSMYLITARQADLSTSSLWTLRNVVVTNVTSEWTNNGPIHRVTVASAISTYRVWTSTPTNDLAKYGKGACFNSDKNSGSSSTDSC